MMMSAEYGMPLTEDAENMPTMAQLSLNFAQGSETHQQSVRSGVFGGYNQSVSSSKNVSFSIEKQQQFGADMSERTGNTVPLNQGLMSNDKLKKLAT